MKVVAKVNGKYKDVDFVIGDKLELEEADVEALGDSVEVAKTVKKEVKADKTANLKKDEVKTK